MRKSTFPYKFLKTKTKIISDDEIVGRKNNRIRLMFDVGNLTAIITGTILILIMVSLLVSMIHFLVNDINQNFSLLQTRF